MMFMSDDERAELLRKAREESEAWRAEQEKQGVYVSAGILDSQWRRRVRHAIWGEPKFYGDSDGPRVGSFAADFPEEMKNWRPEKTCAEYIRDAVEQRKRERGE